MNKNIKKGLLLLFVTLVFFITSLFVLNKLNNTLDQKLGEYKQLVADQGKVE